MINKSLAEQFPELIKSWHPDKNGNLSPHEVAPMSHNRVWWICDKGHEWQTIIYNRTGKNKSGCPYCSGNLASDDNCLQTLYPELAKEWHPDKNGNLSPHEVALKSNKRVWWICGKGHEWQAIISNRSGKNKTDFRYCIRVL
jgi:hypothetical protein